GLATSALPGQPDYMLPDSNEVDAPAYNPVPGGRVRATFAGTTSSAAGPDVLAWSTHHDPVTNAYHLFPLASSNGCAATGKARCFPLPHVFHIMYHDDFPGPFQLQFSSCFQVASEPRFRSATKAVGASGVAPTPTPGQPCPSVNLAAIPPG